MNRQLYDRYKEVRDTPDIQEFLDSLSLTDIFGIMKMLHEEDMREAGPLTGTASF